jgi:mono/diheme cytochrome c family protein
MKLRSFILIAVFTMILAACNYTLAEDVTPPPGYVSPTPLPTLVLSPVQSPSVETGKAIFAEKCAPCHGETGLGDGAQGIQLGVTVPAFGLPEIARPATPADWFTTVTRGRMDRFMPPFTSSLDDEQRWDVISYALSLHITDDLAAKGKQIFEANCKDCSTDFFKDQAKMSTLSEVDLARLAKDGNSSVPAFGASLSQDDLWAVAAYLRSLSFDYSKQQAAAQAATSTPETVSVTDTPAAAEAGTPTGEGTPLAVTEQPTAGAGTEQAATSEPATAAPSVVAKAGFGPITGSIENKTGEALPADMKVTLRGYDHGADPSTGPQEIFSQEGVVNPDGTYTFENIEMPANRIFLAEVVVNGITLQSQYGIAKEGISSLALPALTLYGMTDDSSLLAVDDARLFIDYGDTDLQYYGVYSFRNPSDKTVLIDTKSNTEIPFIKMPEGTSTMGYETLQDSAPMINTNKGIAVPPSANETSYGLLAFTSLPKEKKYDVSQQFVLPAHNMSLFLPEGVTAQGQGLNLTDEGVQNIQGMNFQMYSVQNIAAGQTVKFSVSGEPKQTGSSSSATSQPASNTSSSRQTLLIGAGLLGLALIVAGGWMYLRDRRQGDSDVEEQDHEFESSEDVLDAIVALDDLHRAKKISDEAYQKRRTELKDILKGMM